MQCEWTMFMKTKIIEYLTIHFNLQSIIYIYIFFTVVQRLQELTQKSLRMFPKTS